MSGAAHQDEKASQRTGAFGNDKRSRVFWISLLVVAAVVAVFWPVAMFRFINYDDQLYVTENWFVRHGLTKDGIVWAFTGIHGGNWHPLTTLSHMLDCEIFGVKAGPQHLVNLFFHTANSVLAFLVVRQLTGAIWRSAAVALIFALHPLRVESVAWIAERKDVLSGFFFLLTLFFYTRYVLSRAFQNLALRETRVSKSPPTKLNYILAIVCFALALMSKAMVVTLPFVLLLLDFWPLERFGEKLTNSNAPTVLSSARVRLLLVEKIPFFALSLVMSVVTFLAQRQSGAMSDLSAVPVGERVCNAVVSYVRYLGKTFWPQHLAVYYPYPSHAWPILLVFGGAVILVAISALAVWLARRKPFFAVGWFWFLGTLVPVIGIVQVGSHAMADRFTYLPSIGLAIVLIWMFPPTVAHGHGRIAVALNVFIVAATIAACAVVSSFQLQHWRSSEALFRHTLTVAESALAHNCLGSALVNNPQEAIAHLKTAVRITPDYALAHNNLGAVYHAAGRLDDAIAEFRETLRLQPDNERAHNNLGFALLDQGKVAEAFRELTEAVHLRPDFPDARNNLGKALAEQGKLNDAITQFSTAVQIKPDYPDAQFNLGKALLELGKAEPAEEHLNFALRFQPNFVPAHYCLGNLLLNQKRLDDAGKHYLSVLQTQPNHEGAHYQLATILAAQKHSAAATQHFRAALKIRPDWIEALNNLSWILATAPDDKIRNGREAVELATRAVAVTKEKNAGALDTLAAAYAETGEFEKARKTAQKGITLAETAHQKELADQIRSRLKLYQTGKPFRE